MTAVWTASPGTSPAARRTPGAMARPEWMSAVGLLVAAAYFGVTILRPGLPENLAFVDLMLAPLTAAGFIGMSQGPSPAVAALRRVAPYVVLILLGSLLGLIGVGLPFWAISDMARATFAIFTFFALWHLLWARGLQRVAYHATSIALFFTVGALISDTSARASGYFTHPNYAAHFSVIAAIVLVAGATRWRWRVAYGVAAVAALGLTASFGALAMGAGALVVALVRHLRPRGALLVTCLAASLLVVFVVFDVGARFELDGDEVGVSDTINSQRLERSQNGRLELWGAGLRAFAASPLGIGPDGFIHRGVGAIGEDFAGGGCGSSGCALNLHNDWLSYLIERGPLGLLGLIMLWRRLWQSAPERGTARLVIIAFLVGTVFRETINYRHIWLLLALAIALDTKDWSPAAPDGDPAHVR